MMRTILEEKRQLPPNKTGFNTAEYSKKVFNMFGGKEARIKLQFDNSLIGVVLDRFGKEISIYKADGNSFIVTLDAFMSPPLLGWLFSFGAKVTVLAPESLIHAMRKNALECASCYNKE